ncbi:MAG: hypothetical protein ACQET5_09380 [Halobacteriota archaeon]
MTTDTEPPDGGSISKATLFICPATGRLRSTRCGRSTRETAERT